MQFVERWFALPVLLLMLIAFGCGPREETRQINLDDRKADTARLRKRTEPDDSLVFCFDRRLSPKEDAGIYASLLNYLAAETGYHFTLLFAGDYQETIDSIGTGRAHFAIIGGLSYLKADHDYGVQPLVKGLDEKGGGYYRAAIIAAADSPYNSLSQLEGQIFSFGSRLSTQGYLIPRHMLEKEGIGLSDLKEHFFTGSHQDCARAVILGEAAAGGIQDALAFRLEEEGKIKILALSDYFPRSGIAVSRTVPLKTVARVKAALLGLDPAGEHKDTLKDWSKTEMPGGFTPAAPEDYAQLKTIAANYRLLGD